MNSKVIATLKVIQHATGHSNLNYHQSKQTPRLSPILWQKTRGKSPPDSYLPRTQPNTDAMLRATHTIRQRPMDLTRPFIYDPNPASIALGRQRSAYNK
jgi:hypothetical protein